MKQLTLLIMWLILTTPVLGDSECRIEPQIDRFTKRHEAVGYRIVGNELRLGKRARLIGMRITNCKVIIHNTWNQLFINNLYVDSSSVFLE